MGSDVYEGDHLKKIVLSKPFTCIRALGEKNKLVI